MESSGREGDQGRGTFALWSGSPKWILIGEVGQGKETEAGY